MTDVILPSRQIIEVETENVGRANVVSVFNQATPYRDVPCLLDYVGGTYGGDPTGTHSSSAAVRQFFEDCRPLGAIGDLGSLSGQWALDNATPILIPPNCGAYAPRRGPNRLSYTNIGGVVTSVNLAPGFTFLIDVIGSNRMVPKLAMQGNCYLGNVNFVGADLLADRFSIDVGDYPAIGGGPTIHAPVLCTDHRHDDYGVLQSLGTVTKSGNNVMENIRGVGLYDFVYMGDGLLAEEPWGTQVFSGLQSGTGGIVIDGFSGFVLHRPLGWARVTSGGLNVQNSQFIPPNWTGISQPNSAGPDYALLKWMQRNAVFAEGWHRSVGVYFDRVTLRGFRHGFHFRAGYNDLGPNDQDTGKINESRFRNIGFERVITALELDPYSYMHLTRWEFSGHAMDAYNYAGCNENLIQINTDGALAGAIDKSAGPIDAYKPSHLYATGAKLNNGGRIYYVSVGGTTPATGPGPVGTDPGTSEVIGTATMIYRNDSFKNAGDYTVWKNQFEIDIQEFPGGAFENTSADPHPFYLFRFVSALNWRQATGHHGEALFINRSPTSVLRLSDGIIQANTQSNHAFNVLGADRLDIGFMRFAGYTIDLDSAGVPTEAIPAPLVNVTGVDFSMATISDYGLGTDDDNTDDDDEG